MDRSAYAFTRGITSTRAALTSWNRQPWPVLRSWLAGAFAAAAGLLTAVWIIGTLTKGPGAVSLDEPPFAIGQRADVLQILTRNALVLALHAMACVAGFIAGSSLPLQAQGRTGFTRWVHDHGGRVAIALVLGATIFSLSTQAIVLGTEVGHVAFALHTSAVLLLVLLLPHALPELTALFLPLAAWIIASRRGGWDQLLAATVVTVTIALPILVVCACWEVYVAPHLIWAVLLR
jgi:hypothetical protein